MAGLRAMWLWISFIQLERRTDVPRGDNVGREEDSIEEDR